MGGGSRAGIGGGSGAGDTAQLTPMGAVTVRGRSSTTRRISLMAETRDATRIVDRMTGEDEELAQLIVEETLNAEVARLIYEARTEAGLTQAALAERIGTRQPVIARLEDADYGGHSLSMLQRIADALGQRLELEFVPLKGTLEAA